MVGIYGRRLQEMRFTSDLRANFWTLMLWSGREYGIIEGAQASV